jgi:hypothetical protein
MAAAALSPRGTDISHLSVHVPGRPGRFRGTKARQHVQRVKSLALAQPVASGGIVGDGIPYDVALCFAEAGRGPADLIDRGLIEGKGHSDHTTTILP